MKYRAFSIAFSAFVMMALAACDGGGGGGSGGNAGSGGSGGTAGSGGAGGSGGSAPLMWYTTCGDPVCGDMADDDPNLDNCTTEMAGDSCSTEGQTCELADDTCNANLVCATSDPQQQMGGCPISLASAKHDIEYLTPAERERIRDEVMTMPLATWKYNTEKAGEKEHLGFIIDDQPPSSPAVRPSGERVDLYGYTSMAVAAIQAQDQQIKALRREIEELREELKSARQPLPSEKASTNICAP